VRRRRARRVLPAALALALLLSSASACGLPGGGSGSAVLAQPSALWATPDQYEGDLVRTTGVVQGFQIGTAGEHYVVEDAAPHRIALLGVDHARLATMAGHTVVVVGRFHFSGDTGYTLDVRSIEVAG
jgi:hypothetical protein